MQHIKHIFFDLDHTLWDFETNSDMAFKSIFQKHKVGVNIDKFLNYYRSINQEYWKLYRDEKISKADLRYGRLKDTFNKIKFSVEDELINHLAIDYIEVLPTNNYLFEGAHEILEHLHGNYQLHIITNGFNEVQFKKIENSGLSKYFDQVITSEAAGVKKPNPFIFNFALQQSKAFLNESIMIGDNYEADIMGALNFGMDAILFNFEKKPVGQNIKSVTHLLELKQYL